MFENISFILRGYHCPPPPHTHTKKKKKKKKNMQVSHFINPFVIARKYANKNLGQLAAQMFFKGPLMIDSVLRTSQK